MALQSRCGVASVRNRFLMMHSNKGQNMYEEIFTDISTLIDEATVSSQIYQEPINWWQSTRFQKQRDTNTEITKINTPNHTADSLLNWHAGDVLKNSLSCMQGRFRTSNYWSSFVLYWRHSSRCLLRHRRQSNWNKTLLGYQPSRMVKCQTNQCLFSDLYPHHHETNDKAEDDSWNVHLLLFNHLTGMAAQERFIALWALWRFQGFNWL